MLPLQGAVHRFEDTRQVCAEGAEDDGKVPPFPVQTFQEAKEGRQHKMVVLGLLTWEGEQWMRLALPFQQLQVVRVKALELLPYGRVREVGAAAILRAEAESIGARGEQGGGWAQPLPLT